MALGISQVSYDISLEERHPWDPVLQVNQNSPWDSRVGEDNAEKGRVLAWVLLDRRAHFLKVEGKAPRARELCFFFFLYNDTPHFFLFFSFLFKILLSTRIRFNTELFHKVLKIGWGGVPLVPWTDSKLPFLSLAFWKQHLTEN